jgi:hypothetical protein
MYFGLKRLRRRITMDSERSKNISNKHGVGMICIGHSGREHEGKKQLARPRRRWEDNIKMDLKETGHEGVD